MLKRHALTIERQDYRAGLICAVLANINRDPKRTKTFTPQDFMPGNRPRQSKTQSPEEMFGIINLIYGAPDGN